MKGLLWFYYLLLKYLLYFRLIFCVLFIKFILLFKVLFDGNSNDDGENVYKLRKVVTRGATNISSSKIPLNY